MADKSTDKKPNNSSAPSSESTSNSTRITPNSAQILAQFTAAKASNYIPKPQAPVPVNPPAQISHQTTTVYTAQPPTTSGIANQTATKLNTFSAPAPLPIDLKTFKGFKFVTLDPLLIETRSIYDEVADTFKWEMCQDQEDRCISFLQDTCANKRTFLISSGGLGRKVVPKIHDLPQVYAIYIYCADVVAHQEWAQKYSKVRTVCNDDDKYLIPQLAIDVAQANIDWGTALLSDGNRVGAKEKFEKALKNLTQYVNADSNMVPQLKRKIEECK